MVQSDYDLSLIVACYNEESHLEESIRQTIEVLDSTVWTYEIIFVEDRSQDGTRQVIERILAEYPAKNMRAMFHEHNRGRGRTVADGFRIARGRIVGFLDIDLEVHARYIPSMVLAIQNGADVATAYRIYKVQPRLFVRFILSTGYRRLTRYLLGIDLEDTETGFKFFKREKVLAILDEIKDEGWFWDTEIMVRSLLRGYQITEIPCLFIRRYDKKSTVRVFHDTVDYFAKLWRFLPVARQAQEVVQSELSVSATPSCGLDAEGM